MACKRHYGRLECSRYGCDVSRSWSCYGDEIRISGVLGNTAANGTFKVSVLTANTFQLIGYDGNGAYAGDGHWVKLIDSTPSGDSLAQAVSGNVITGNGLAGFYADLKTGTAFQGDIVRNNISLNGAIGVHIESHSYGQGIDLPLDPTNPFDLPVKEDVSFDVNIGTGSAGDSNTFDRTVWRGSRLKRWMLRRVRSRFATIQSRLHRMIIIRRPRIPVTAL